MIFNDLQIILKKSTSFVWFVYTFVITFVPTKNKTKQHLKFNIMTTINNSKIITALQKDHAKELKAFKARLFSKDVDLNHWGFTSLLTPTTKKKGYFKTEKEYKNYLLKRFILSSDKKLASQISTVESILTTDFDIEEINISVEWTKSRTWGANPKAEIKVYGNNGKYQFFKSGFISGCGYDKESTAIAEALNQCKALIKLMYQLKEKNFKKENREIFGYGSGYRERPQFEGGVGVSCYYRIFEILGFKFEKLGSGKTYDIYKATKK